MISQLQVGPTINSDGVIVTQRAGKQGDSIASELHGRFYEQCYRGNVFSAGSSTTALSANTISLTSGTTPIVGVYNPATSSVNLVILQAMLQVSVSTASTTAPGSLVWASSIGNAAISTGAAPFNRKTLASVGSQAKAFNGGVALTGLTNNLVIFEGADMQSSMALTTALVPATAVIPTAVSVQNFDGGLIVPPGGVLALLNTVSTTTLSVASRLMWEEVPV